MGMVFFFFGFQTLAAKCIFDRAPVLKERNWWVMHDEGEYQNIRRCSAESIMQISISVIQLD
jgi:hypothetical protein